MRLASYRSLACLWSLTCCFTFAQTAYAQNWSLQRERPSLLEIVAVDPTAEPAWPFGSEDIAKDGVATYAADEAAVDLRSVYADARARRLWLRAYFSAKTDASTTALTFFFIDTDLRSDTGGRAQGAELWPALTDDPSKGGYELAIGVKASGEIIGVFSWLSDKKGWSKHASPSLLETAERGVARDPLRLLGNDHVYTQVTLGLADAGLDDRCLANIFVRSWNDATGARAFGDVVDSLAMTCRPRLNAYGDPEVLRTDRCVADDTCPGAGRCREGLCVFGYECSSDEACQSGQRCQASVCVRYVQERCATSADCAGLLCESAQCVACTDSGARACAAGSVCAPDGRCLSLSEVGYSDPDKETSDAAASGERVQGGSFHCSMLLPSGRGSACAWLTLLALAWHWKRRRRRRLRSGRGGDR
jgi:hypothetical protein